MLVATLPSGELVGELSAAAGRRRRQAHRLRFGLSVADAHRGHGIGRALIQCLLRWAASVPQIEKISLGVFADNLRAINLYKSLGFHVEGRRTAEFRLGPGRYADDLIMAAFISNAPSPPVPP
jgi:RimJ/RimL family protein N-acetyltransferase